MFISYQTSNSANPEDTVRHEYGHTRQFAEMDPITYALMIGIPSWLNFGSGPYYDKPWEVTADIYGGVVSRDHSQQVCDRGNTYLAQCRILSLLLEILLRS